MELILKEHQQQAIDFISNNESIKKNTLIEGGTGIGKTIIALAFSRFMRGNKNHRILVICPKTAVMSFSRDTNKFDLGLKTICIETPKEIGKWLQYTNKDKVDVLVIAMHVLAQLKESILDTFEGFEYLCIDEIHELRNGGSKKFNKAMYIKNKGLKVIGLTATLFYTRLEDVYWVFKFIDNTLFNSFDNFQNRYLNFIDRDIRIQRKVQGEFGTHNEDSRTSIKSFDGYTDKVDEVWDLIEPYIFSCDHNNRFNIKYSFIPYELDSIDDFRNKLKGQGIYSILTFTLESKDKKEEVTKKPSDLIPTFYRGMKIEVRADKLKVGDYVYTSRSTYKIKKIIKEKDDTKLSQVIIPVVQRYLSKSNEKFNKLLEVLGKDKGTLIYCQFIETAQLLRSRLHNLGYKVYLLDGSVKNKKQALLGIDWDKDVVIATQSASQSMDYYFDRVILYEPISHPGKFIQLRGRIMRTNSKHTNLEVLLLCCFNTLEEYSYIRMCMMIKQSGSYDMELPIESNFDSLDELKKEKLWGLIYE